MRTSSYPKDIYDINAWKISSSSLVDEITNKLITNLPREFLPAEPYKNKWNEKEVYFPTVFDDENGIALNLIPGGSFTFGLSRRHEIIIENMANGNEYKLISELIKLSRRQEECAIAPFLASRFPLSDLAAENVLKKIDQDVDRPVYDDGSDGPFPIALSKEEAIEFNKKSGYRFPSAQEWEYIAKEGKEYIFLGGNEMPHGKELGDLCLTNYGSSKKNERSYNSYGIAAMAVSNMVSFDKKIEVRAGAAEFYPFQGAAEWAMLLTELRIPLNNMPGGVSAVRPCLDIPEKFS